MVNEREDWLHEDEVHEALSQWQEPSPPKGFSARVMAGLEPKRPGLWCRLRLWIMEPRAITVTPLALGSAVAALLLVFVAGHQLNTGSEPSMEPRGVTVRFLLPETAAQARTVAVVGSFNNWKGEEAVMRYDEQLHGWVLEAQLPPGDHEYMYLLDGNRLLTDPLAQMTRDDGFGNRNSVLLVGQSDAMSL